MGTQSPETCREKKQSILRKTVHQVGFIYKIIQGYRSTKHKKNKILPIILRCRNLAVEPSVTVGFNPSAHCDVTLRCRFPWGPSRRNMLYCVLCRCCANSFLIWAACVFDSLLFLCGVTSGYRLSSNDTTTP